MKYSELIERDTLRQRVQVLQAQLDKELQRRELHNRYCDTLLQKLSKCIQEERQRCIELATDAIAFNGGSVQMEAHVRAAISKG